MSGKPDAVIALPDAATVEEARGLSQRLASEFPDWRVAIFGGVKLYYPTDDGELVLAAPMPVLSGEDVTAYLDNLRGEG